MIHTDAGSVKGQFSPLQVFEDYNVKDKIAEMCDSRAPVQTKTKGAYSIYRLVQNQPPHVKNYREYKLHIMRKGDEVFASFVYVCPFHKTWDEYSLVFPSKLSDEYKVSSKPLCAFFQEKPAMNVVIAAQAADGAGGVDEDQVIVIEDDPVPAAGAVEDQVIIIEDDPMPAAGAVEDQVIVIEDDPVPVAGAVNDEVIVIPDDDEP